MLRRAVLILLALAPFAVSAQLKPGVPVAGRDYVVLTPPQPTWGTGGVEVVEVFSYACIHCAEIQPLINSWKKNLPAGVKFRYVPAAFGGAWDNAARAFFAAEAMGVQERTQDAVFKATFIDKSLKGSSLEAYADLYASLGVNRAKFLEIMNSTTVSAKVNRARQFAQRTGVNSTPTLIVNGKYRITGKSHENNLQIADYLIARELAAAPKPVAKPVAKPAAGK
jgi:protein dithiol oxidoreductase (disulfide-forming)